MSPSEPWQLFQVAPGNSFIEAGSAVLLLALLVNDVSNAVHLEPIFRYYGLFISPSAVKTFRDLTVFPAIQVMQTVRQKRDQFLHNYVDVGRSYRESKQLQEHHSHSALSSMVRETAGET